MLIIKLHIQEKSLIKGHRMMELAVKSDFSGLSHSAWACVKVPVSAHQVLPIMGHIFDVSYRTSATWVTKI